MKTAMTQTEAVLEYLKAYGTITSMEAFAYFGATRLSDIIMRLRKNHIIELEMKESNVKNQYGKYSRYGLYTYIGEKEPKIIKTEPKTISFGKFPPNDFKWYYFEDGYRCACRGMDAAELATEERKHGKLVKCFRENS